MNRGRKGIQVEGTACMKAWGAEGVWRSGIPGSQPSLPSEALSGNATLPQLHMFLVCAQTVGTAPGWVWPPEGRVVPSRPCHQPQPTSPVPGWQGQPLLAAPTPRSWPPLPLFSPVSCPSLSLSSLQLFLWQSLSHSGQQPQTTRTSGQTEVSPGVS